MNTQDTVTKILFELADRKGFDDWWFGIGLDIRREIIKDLIVTLDNSDSAEWDNLEYLLSGSSLDED